ncbi:hypothetical protein COV11_04195 [Candidatus Woesearchaeota archaeon CG10_big_fil_rev_8_21_14_0_10_30_7]|nr:MAG: hypothetical protein COV11_04195 [Candidatus Woesearchaeota archaeon CG10_big_fil_rev_8_21_14_0_10_30_7]
MTEEYQLGADGMKLSMSDDGLIQHLDEKAKPQGTILPVTDSSGASVVETKQPSIDDLLNFANTISGFNDFESRDYMTALFLLDNAPIGYNVDALYAGVMLTIATHLDAKDDDDTLGDESEHVLTDILNAFKTKTGYNS